MRPRDGDRILLALSEVELQEHDGWLVYEPERHRFHLEDPEGATCAIFPERTVLSLQRYGLLRPGTRGWVLAPKGWERLRSLGQEPAERKGLFSLPGLRRRCQSLDNRKNSFIYS